MDVRRLKLGAHTIAADFLKFTTHAGQATPAAAQQAPLCQPLQSTVRSMTPRR